MFNVPAIPNDFAPLEACLTPKERCVLAVIIGVDGPSYRQLGAMMAILEGGKTVGTLSSGCVESDIKLHAFDCLNSGSTSVVRYGRGSPYLDIVLPCGGGLQIILIPNPDMDTIGQILQTVVSDRVACTLEIQTATGELSLSKIKSGRSAEQVFRTRLIPELKFLVFGKGPELTTFAALTQSANFETTLLSPDTSTLAEAMALGCKTIELTVSEIPKTVKVDARTAIVLFFHDHDWEPPILRGALTTSAFYVGAQGSRRTRDNRMASLRKLSISDEALARLRGPIGLINSARDARTLAISVLAEVISVAEQAKANLLGPKASTGTQNET